MEKRLCSKLGIVLIIVGSVFILTTAAALAASNSQLDSSEPNAPGTKADAFTLSVTGMVSSTQPISGNNMIANTIALFFGTEVTEVVGLRSDGFGYGEIAKVYFLATAAATDTTSIVEMRESKMGWGQIAKAVGEHPGNKGNNLGMIVSGRGTISDTVAAGEADTSTVGSHGQGNAYGQQKEQGNQGRGQEQGKGHDKEHDQGKGHDKEHGGGKKD